MRFMLAAIGLVLSVGAAHAQFVQQPDYWNSQRFGNRNGGTTFYNGSVGGQPFTGNSQTFGNQTYSHFYGSNGSATNCTTSRFGGMTSTTCY